MWRPTFAVMRLPVALLLISAHAQGSSSGSSSAGGSSSSSSNNTRPLPSSRQRTHMSWQKEMFVHYSITTFTSNQSGAQDPALFAPNSSALNVSQWVEAAVIGGFPVATLTAKHEAGFAIWPTAFNSHYSILSSPTVAHRDLVREFVDECRRQGVIPGLYFTTGAAPCDFDCQQGQITELASSYGDIGYWWFDHHGTDPTHEMFDQVVAQHNPAAVRLGPDSTVAGEESGYLTYPVYNSCNTTDGTMSGRCLAAAGPATGSPDGTVFRAWEADCSDYSGCHPWYPNGRATAMPLPELMGKWEASWGRGGNMILNLPPEASGAIAPDLVESAAAFRAERERRYEGAGVVGTANGTLTAGDADAGLVLELGGVRSIDRILLAESELFTQGQMVGAYTLEASAASLSGTDDDDWVQLSLNSNATGSCAVHAAARCGGATIGLRHLDVLDPPVNASRLRLRLVETLVPGAAVPVSMSAISSLSASSS
jgi:alpha-L-fucosidase